MVFVVIDHRPDGSLIAEDDDHQIYNFDNEIELNEEERARKEEG